MARNIRELWKHPKVGLYCAWLACLACLILSLPALTVWLGLPPEGDAVDYRVPLVRWIVQHKTLPNWPWTFVDDYPLLGDLLMALFYAASPYLMRLVPIGGYVLCGYFAGKIFLQLTPNSSNTDKKTAFFTAAAWALALRPVALQANLLMVDTLAAAFTLGSFYCFLEKHPARSGIFAALALSTRYTAWANIAIIGLLHLIRAYRGEKRGRNARLISLWAFFAIAAIGASPWLIRNTLVNANPIFPLATELFNGFSLGVFDNYGRGKDLLSLLLLPYDLLFTNSFLRSFYDYTLGKLFYAQLAAVALLAFWKPKPLRDLFRRARRTQNFRYLSAFVFLHTLSWFYSSQQLRFLDSALVLLNLVMLWVCFELYPRLLVGALTLLCVFSALSIQKDSILIALGRRESPFSAPKREAERCFSSAGIRKSDLVGHYNRDGALGFFGHRFVYGPTNSYFLPLGPALDPDYIYDPQKLHKIGASYVPWPADSPCLWKKRGKAAQ